MKELGDFTTVKTILGNALSAGLQHLQVVPRQLLYLVVYGMFASSIPPESVVDAVSQALTDPGMYGVAFSVVWRSCDHVIVCMILIDLMWWFCSV